jgi:uncharacterized protein (TIGR03083 family)
MEASRYLECLAADYNDLRDAVATVELTATVPSCPGWTVADLVLHIARVYLHKAAIIRTGREPDPWPPPALAAEPRLPLLGRAYGELRAGFRAHEPGESVPTWFGPDQTVGFWIRRMAQETVIHRVDAELAAGVPVTPVPGDLAADGVDEVLKRMLAYTAQEWPEDFEELAGGHPPDVDADADGRAAIVIAAGEQAWTIRPGPGQVLVEDGAQPGSQVRIEGPPGAVLRWVWGRAGDDAVQLSGDPAWADYLRRLLAVVTQ